MPCKVLLFQKKLSLFAGGSREEKEFFVRLASRCRKSFPRMAVSCLDRAQMLIDRNVNQKILFTDLVGRLYLSF